MAPGRRYSYSQRCVGMEAKWIEEMNLELVTHILKS